MDNTNPSGGHKGPRLDILPRITPGDIARVVGHFPKSLRDRNIWVCADRTPVNGKSSKRPLSSCGYESGFASSTDKDTWMSFAEATRFALEDDRVACLGIMIEGEDLIAVDYDHVIGASSVVGADFEAFLKRMPTTYTERSPGRDGLHQIYSGKLPETWRKKLLNAFGDGAHLECYTSGRYLTVTGDMIGDTSNILGLVDQNDPPGPLLERLARPERNDADQPAVEQHHSREEIEHMLWCIDNTGEGAHYDDWMTAAMACYTLLGAREGYEVFHEWSSQSSKHNDETLDYKWPSFADLQDPPGWGSLCKLAGDDATQPPPTAAAFGEMVVPEAMKDTPAAQPEKGEASVPLYMGGADYRAYMGSAEFAIQGFLPKRGIVQIFGQPGAGKSLVALSLAMAMACGEETWHGMAVHVHGPVAFMVGEDGTGVAARFIAECIIRDIDPATVPIVFSTAPTELLDGDSVAAHGQAMVDALGAMPVAVFTDTFATNYGKGNEDSTEDMSTAMANASSMQRSMKNLMIFVHHSGVDKDARGRGNSAFLAACDAEFRVVQRPGGAEGKPSPEQAFGDAPAEAFERTGDLVRVEPKKVKNWRRGEPIEFEICGVPIGQDSHGEVESGGIVVPFIPPPVGPECIDLVPEPLQAVCEELLLLVEERELEGLKTSRKDLTAVDFAGISKHARDDFISQLLDTDALAFLDSSGKGRAQTMKVSDNGRKWLEERML